MNLTLELQEIKPEDKDLVGGKGFALSVLSQNGFVVPRALAISSLAYSKYVQATGLNERISMELNRKDFKDMRWEEIWDASLRIRNMFLKTTMPRDLREELAEIVGRTFADNPVAVRSSAPGEDSAKTSFAGLHESYVNIRGGNNILEHVLKVWASLWSDAALLYRQELGLDAEKSTMSVLVQEIVLGQRSGVAFGQNPNNFDQAVIESVYGLNQGLVDGTVEPDRWILDRQKKTVISHNPASREKYLVPTSMGLNLEPLPVTMSEKPPLEEQEVCQILDLVLDSEQLFGWPQDLEWTFQEKTLFTLQSRPITTTRDDQGYYSRSWYLSLRRSYQNLKNLRERIEKELIPEMIQEAEKLKTLDLGILSDQELQQEIQIRQGIYDKWQRVYWQEFIPFAHGARLFGQVYNDILRPADPYEFIQLLGTGYLVSLKRNESLEDMAKSVRDDPDLAQILSKGDWSKVDQGFKQKMESFMDQFGSIFCHEASCTQDRQAILRLVQEMAKKSSRDQKMRKEDLASLQEEFLSRFEGQDRVEAEELLDLARASYKLRDDDNIHLGRIEGQLLSAVQEGLSRLGDRIPANGQVAEARQVVKALKDPSYVPEFQKPQHEGKSQYQIKARQLIGQPAGPGLATGKARVINGPADLREFKSGEILICDSVDPNMTFVVPLAAAIVERRGGMLIHGAIIAREYGLPCVTGIPEATSFIQTGQTITVDGYSGIVIIGNK